MRKDQGKRARSQRSGRRVGGEHDRPLHPKTVAKKVTAALGCGSGERFGSDPPVKRKAPLWQLPLAFWSHASIFE